MAGYTNTRIKYSGPTNPPQLPIRHVTPIELQAIGMAKSGERGRHGQQDDLAYRTAQEYRRHAEAVKEYTQTHAYQHGQQPLPRQAPPARPHAVPSRNKPKSSSFMGKLKSFFSSEPSPPTQRYVPQNTPNTRHVPQTAPSSRYVPKAVPSTRFPFADGSAQDDRDILASPAAAFHPGSRFAETSKRPPVRTRPIRQAEVRAPTRGPARSMAASVVDPSRDNPSQASRVTRFPSHRTRETAPPVPTNRQKDLPRVPSTRHGHNDMSNPERLDKWLHGQVSMPASEVLKGMCKRCGDPIVSATMTFSSYCDKCKVRVQGTSRSQPARQPSSRHGNSQREDSRSTSSKRPAPPRIDASVGRRGNVPQQLQRERFVPPLMPPVPTSVPDSPTSIYSRTTNLVPIPRDQYLKRREEFLFRIAVNSA